jgi:hypothetical protein
MSKFVRAIKQVLEGTIHTFYSASELGISPNVIEISPNVYTALWWEDGATRPYNDKEAQQTASSMRIEMITELAKRNVSASVTTTIYKDDFYWGGKFFNCKDQDVCGNQLPFIVHLMISVDVICIGSSQSPIDTPKDISDDLLDQKLSELRDLARQLIPVNEY